MKQFLRIAFAQLLVCLTISAFAQTPQEQWSTPGNNSWVCPPGISSVTLYIWSAGGAGAYFGSGAGGNLVHTTAIPVTPGQIYTVFVGYQVVNPDSAGYSNSAFQFGDSTIVAAYGPYLQDNIYGAPTPAPAWGGNYVLRQYIGGAGLIGFGGGGGGAASDCSNGFPGNADGTGGISYHCGGGFWGGDGGNYGQNGPGHASGAGGATTYGAVTKPGPALILMYYTCDGVGTTGTIGNAHTVTYPPELAPDKILSIIDPVLPLTSVIGWQQSTDNINFVTAKNSTNTNSYRFDRDSLQTVTYYRRGNNACIAGDGFGNWSDTVQIKVMTSANGRNGKITGYVQSRNGTPISNRKVFAQSLTPLKGRAVGYLDSTFSDDNGKFSIDTVFYGDKNNGDSATVRFNVYPDTTGHHLYDPSSIKLSLSALNPVYDIAKHFSDTTSFAVTGQVTQICYGCLNNQDKADTITGTVDSVKIIGIGARHPNPREIDSTYTGWRKPPGKYGNYGLIFQETDTYKVTPTFKNNKIIPKDTSFYLGGNRSNINFVDTSTRVISGFFGAGCNDFIGTAVLEFYDSLPKGHDGKPRTSEFRKRVTTDANGNYSIRLPARGYNVKIIKVTVSDAIDPSTKQSTIISYFKTLPATNKYRDITSNNKVLNLLYQRPPQIAVSGLYDDSSRVATCSAFKNYDFWPQSVRRPVTFKVYQGPVSRGCALDTGTIYVTTDISNTLGNYQHDTVKFTNGIGVDSIMAAQPNTVINPQTGTYSKKFTAIFTDIMDRSISTDTLKPALPIVVVTGAAVDPNSTNFVTVSPQLPFVVLHDPPGNRSISSWAQSVTTEQAVSFKAEQENNLGGFVNVKVGLSQIIGMFVTVPLKFWVNIDQKFSTTNTTTNTSESVITNTTEQEIFTADDPPSTGEGADVVYGAALNINYKQGTEIEWDSSKCEVVGPRIVMVTDIKNDTTSFVYTIGHIQDELIPTLQQAADAQTRADSAAYFENQIHVWEQLVANNSENIKNAPVLQNISFSNGTTTTYTNTLENSTSNTYDFNLEVDKDFAISTGFEIAGTGLEGGVNVGFKMTTGGSTTNTSKTSTTTSYTLKDDNGPGPHFSGDYFSVNVKKDPVYGTPMFETVAGGSMCPYVPGTIPLDNPVITANVQTLTNVKKDTATFTLYLNNLSLDATPNGKRPYVLFLNASSNPSGATVLIGGSSDPNGVTYVIPNNGGVQQATISVIRNTASGVYNYDDLEFIMSDNCYESPVAEKFFNAPHQYSTIQISADFQSPVSGVTLISPVNNWAANIASNNIVPVTFNDYDTSKLTSIALQYSVPGTSNWSTGFTIAKKNLGSISTTSNWDISKIADGPYNLRLKVKDKNNNVIYSKAVKGKIDRRPPQLFGTAQPASTVYTAGTQISYSYSENINISNSTVKMRDMTDDKNMNVDLSVYNNMMIVMPRNSITANIGHLYRVIADAISDIYGNVKTMADTMYFTVNPSVFGTGADGLNIASKNTSIYEDGKGSMDVKFTRNSPATSPIVIYYNLSGNSNYLTDYTVKYNAGQTPLTGISGAQGAIILPKDSSSVTMYIKPVNDFVLSPDKKITFTLSPGGGYTIGSNYSVTDTILNHNTVKPVITADKGTTLCTGDSVTLSTANKINGVNVKSYLWSNGATIKSTLIKTSGAYSVKVTDNNGLVGYSDTTVVTFTCGSPTGLVADAFNKSKAALSWNAVNCAKKYCVKYRLVGNGAWKTDTVNTNRDTLTGLKANGEYQWQVATICQYPVIVISEYTLGYNFTTPVALTEIAVTNSDDYKQASAGDGFSAKLYPNPATNNANLAIKGFKGSYTIIVTNLQGETLWKAENVTDNNVKLSLTNYAAGIYMVTVFDKEHTGRLKLVKQ